MALFHKDLSACGRRFEEQIRLGEYSNPARLFCLDRLTCSKNGVFIGHAGSIQHVPCTSPCRISRTFFHISRTNTFHKNRRRCRQNRRLSNTRRIGRAWSCRPGDILRIRLFRMNYMRPLSQRRLHNYYTFLPRRAIGETGKRAWAIRKLLCHGRFFNPLYHTNATIV